MSVLNKVKKLAADNNATLVIDNGWGVEVWELWLNERDLEWVESGSRVLSQCYGNDCQSWQRDAYRELVESVSCGVVNK